MGFRLRRTIRLGKLLRLNVSKSGVSMSVGTRGASVNIGKQVRATVGLPGTGLSYSTRLDTAPDRKRANVSIATSETTSVTEYQTPTNHSYIEPKKKLPFANEARGFLLAIFAGLFGLGLLVSLFSWEKPGILGFGLLSVWLGSSYWSHRKRTNEILEHNRLVDERMMRAANQRDEEARQARERERRIRETYGEMAANIFAKKLWLGCPEAGVIEMFGQPEARDEKVSKESVVQTFKYFSSGKNRYGLRVEIENGAVCGWDDKRQG